MKKINILLILISAIICFSCDPSFKHNFKGKVLSSNHNFPLKDVKIEYSFYPIENLHHWRANVYDRDSILYTDEDGEFKIDFHTLTLSFDSLKIKVSKEGFKEKTLSTKRDEWKSDWAFSQKRFQFNFGKIELDETEMGF